MQVLTASQTITDCIKICEDQDTCTIGALYQISTINYCYQSEEWLQFISYPNTYSYSAIRKIPFSQLCTHGFISFLFMVKTKGDLNEDSMISLLSYDHIDQTSSSLDITLALENDISTKISFDGEHLKEKPIEKDIASYRDFVEITIECDNSMFNVYINGHLHDVYTDITPGLILCNTPWKLRVIRRILSLLTFITRCLLLMVSWATISMAVLVLLILALQRLDDQRQLTYRNMWSFSSLIGPRR